MRTRLLILLAIATCGSAMTAQVKTSKQQTVEQKKATESVAWAGVKTRTPSKEECIQYALNLEVRYQGQLVTNVVAKSAAAKAGIEVGDIILMMGKVGIFSKDDIADVVMVRKPGQVVDVRLLKAKTKKEKSVLLKLGSKKIPKRKKARLQWHYAGLPYLEEALARAKKEKKRVLVGLSGAET